MKRPFKDMREAAINVADIIGDTLDENFTVFSEGYEFEKYAFIIKQLSVPDGMTFKLEISADDLERFFYGLPQGSKPRSFQHLCETDKTNPLPLDIKRDAE